MATIMDDKFKKYLILTVPVIVIAGTAFWFARSEGPLPGADLPEITVELVEGGFVPREVIILAGQKVIFKTDREKPFWPASDLHPTHEVYSEFDPRQPIEPGHTWTFQFDKSGEWKYHDHLSPYHRGVIKVLERTEKLNLGDCEDIDTGGESDKVLQCWDEMIREAAQEKGVGYSMQLLAKFYKDPVFARNCHNFSHTIGGEAYFEFKKKGELEMSPEMNYCGFGFYHGFMETLFAKGDSIQLARDLCAYMDGQIDNPLQYARGACFHGIGHGVVDGSDKGAWGNAQALLEPGLKLCNAVAITDEEHFRCYSGAFNSISIAYSGDNYGLSIDPKDPLRLCREQEEKYRRACYADMAVAVMDVAADDLARAAKLVESVEEDPYAMETMKNVAGLSVRPMLGAGDTDFKKVILTCKSVQDRLRLSCIRGFGAALIEFGEPGREYARSFEFCGNPVLSDDEKRACFRDSIYLIRATVKAGEMEVVCGELDAKFRDLCEA